MNLADARLAYTQPFTDLFQSHLLEVVEPEHLLMPGFEVTDAGLEQFEVFSLAARVIRALILGRKTIDFIRHCWLVFVAITWCLLAGLQALEYPLVFGKSHAHCFRDLLARGFRAGSCPQMKLGILSFARLLTIVTRAGIGFAQFIQNGAGNSGIGVSGEVHRARDIVTAGCLKQSITPVCTRSLISTWAGKRRLIFLAMAWTKLK